MSWYIDRYKIVGGIFAGYGNTPKGTLTGFAMLVGDDAGTFGSYGSPGDPPEKEWAGAFGSKGDPILEYGKNHADQGYQYNVPLFELEFETPPTADFERQTLMIYGSVNCTKSEGTDHGESYLGYNYDMALSKFTRRWFKNGQWFEELIDDDSASIGSGNWVKSIGDIYFEDLLLIKKIYYAISPFTFDNTNYLGAAIYLEDENGNEARSWNGGALISLSTETLTEYFGSFEPEEETEDPNEDDNPGNDDPGNEEDGGGGNHNRPVDNVEIPPLPTLQTTDAGFITLYHMSIAEMWLFAQHFFASSLLDIIRLYFNNPMDIFVSAGILPFTPTGNSMWYPQIGGAYISSQALQKVDDQFYEVDCGSIYIEKYGNNCFDFSPYTKINIFLPYIGYRELPVDEVMGQNVHVVYHIDVLSGDCVAFISTKIPRKILSVPADVVIAQYTGNCLTQIPVGSVSFDQMVRGLIDLTVSAVDTGAKAVGNLSGLTGESGGMESIGASAAAIVAGAKPTTRSGGAIGSTAGYMSIQKPYIIREIPNQSLPDNYGLFFGYPCNRSGRLGDSNFKGFAMVEDIQLNDIPATGVEREEILDWLRKGVLL